MKCEAFRSRLIREFIEKKTRINLYYPVFRLYSALILKYPYIIHGESGDRISSSTAWIPKDREEIKTQNNEV
jgi:hypothetical protein